LGTWDYDPITGDLKWDERCKAMFGLPPEAEVNYEVFLEGLHPEDRKRVDGVVQCALDPKSSGEFDIEYRTVGLRDRIERWVAARGQAFFDETGRAVRFIGTILEITERKRAEEVIKSRARQQAVIADLGIRALMNNDLSAVMDEAVTLVAHALRVEYCKVLELLPGEEELLLRAGVGWKEGFVGNATVRADLDSQVGYTLASDTPVVVEDLRTEKRFIGAPLLHEHGVVSGLNVIIHGPEGPFGVLGAHTKEKRTFTEDDVNFLQAVANVVSAAVERKRAEERLSEIKESERRRIAADLHDEVLQDMVHGLQEIQIAQLTSQRDGQDNAPDLKESLETASEALQRSVEGLRVAIFELHLEEILERSFVSSVEALVELNRRMSRKRFEVHMTVADGFPEAIPTQAGRSLLRILQEALSNARRHSGAKHIWVTLRTEGDDVYAEVADNGQGFDTESARGGVGTSAIRQRALDLGGALEIQSEPGAGTVVRFRGPAEHLFGG
jgi:PAS domain S-box-containing protein